MQNVVSIEESAGWFRDHPATERTNPLAHLSQKKTVQSPSVDDFTELMTIAQDAIRTVAEQKKRIETLQKLSVTDELTGLLNRRGFHAALNRVLDESYRYEESGFLSLVDLDRFKDVNDTFGHEAGDKVLQRVAEILKKNTRSTDYTARIGGDEFAVIFVRAKGAPLFTRLEQLQRDLNSSYVLYNGNRIGIEASIGTTQFRARSDASSLIRRADDALYAQKSQLKQSA